jgi:hypothetical protein
MKVDGLAPGQGNQADRLGAKRPQAAPGKSFADALKKAGQAASGAAVPGSQPAGSQPAFPAPAPMPPPPPPSAEDHISTVKYRLQSGYYESKKVEDALTDKLSGYFDDLA